MDFKSYEQYFADILEGEVSCAPYDQPDYLDYTKLNFSRFRRWMKTASLSPETVQALKRINSPQNWIIITEPWCGDAAHSLPFIELMARENPLIKTYYELRDSEPHRINDYLTGTSKSIPKVILRDENGTDLALWGPRPQACQDFYLQGLKQGMEAEALKQGIQKWYNADKGLAIQREICALIEAPVESPGVL